MVFGALLAGGLSLAGGLFGASKSDKRARRVRNDLQNSFNNSNDLLDALLQRNVDAVNSIKNPWLDALSGDINSINSGIDSMIPAVRASRNALSDLPQLLERSALTRTDTGRRDALRSARAGAGGRGLAFSAAAGAIGARSAQDAATSQNVALTEAMVTARTAQAQQTMQALQLEANLSDLRQRSAQLRIAGAGMRENRAQMLYNLFASDTNARAGLSGTLLSAIAGVGSTQINAGASLMNTGLQGFNNSIGGLSGSSFQDFLKGLF